MNRGGADSRCHFSGKHLPSRVILLALAVVMRSSQAQPQPSSPSMPVPQLNGARLRITALEENGFLDINPNPDYAGGDDNGAEFIFSGYLIDVLNAVSRPDRANFSYTLLPPSGYGSLCSPRLNASDPNDSSKAYAESYQTQYNCGASDVNDAPTIQNITTDMYLGMYYVTPSRQLQNQFTIPFMPPRSGTLQMFGYATRIQTFQRLVELQASGEQPAACAPAGTALINFVETAYPGLQVKGIFGGEDEIYQAFQTGECQVYIVDGPVAAQFVLRQSRRDRCTGANGMPIGLIGDPMDFGVSHYAIGIRRDVPIKVERTISYWLNVLMSCSPLDPNGECPDGNLATFYDGQGGTGEECGYELFPPEPISLQPEYIVAIVLGCVALVVIAGYAWHRWRIRRQEALYAKQAAAANAKAEREREMNEHLVSFLGFLAHEIRNPLASAIAALSFVSAKTADSNVVAEKEDRDQMNADVTVIDNSLTFVNELLRNMLDLQKSSVKRIKLDLVPTDVLRDVFEPVASILFLRGAIVDVQLECPKNLIILADRMRLKQIFLNLANNATKFVETGFIRLRAEVVSMDIDTEDQELIISSNHSGNNFSNVYLYCEDSGQGIPVEKRDRLFAQFQESLDVLNQGTGIGLSLCKSLSELMGADLYLDETYQSGLASVGTRFVLRMNSSPIQALESEHAPSVHSFSDDVAPNASNSSAFMTARRELPENLSVLFTDDDAIIRKMFSRAIKRVAPTWKITEASNGETALRMVENETFDLIFMDEYMAAVEKQLLGSETVRLLRGRGVTSLICGLSANDKEEQFTNSGANAFMFKPFPAKKDDLQKELLTKLFPPKH